jgi:DnaJ family protein C protein 19
MAKILLILGLVGVVMIWWRGRGGAPKPRMPAGEARRLLGVAEGAGLDEIRSAHRRLIARVHPDAGGSAELAERVNVARDTLLAEMNRGTPRAS